MKIYLTDLQAYNEGHLVGRWITLPLTGFELAQALSEVLNEGETAKNGPNGPPIAILSGHLCRLTSGHQ